MNLLALPQKSIPLIYKYIFGINIILEFYNNYTIFIILYGLYLEIKNVRHFKNIIEHP